MGRIQPSNRTIVGLAMVLFASVLMGFAMHHLISTGTCSSTGYSANYGPVPHCPKGTGWWILFITGGVFLCIIGGALVSFAGVGVIIGSIFSAIGAGSLSVAFSDSAKSSTKVFAAIFGGSFLLGGVIPLMFTLWGAARKAFRTADTPASTPLSPKPMTPTPSPFGTDDAKPDAILGAYAAAAGSHSSPAPQATVSLPPTFRTAAPAPKAEDPIDKLAKLAELRKQGALTDDEFAREKAKLLGEI